MVGQHIRVTSVSQPPEQPGGTLDVGEEKSKGPHKHSVRSPPSRCVRPHNGVHGAYGLRPHGLGIQWARRPPSMIISVPVVKVESSDARKATAPEISLTSARRPMGVCGTTPPSFSCSFIGVLTPPGQMALTRMPSGASSSAAVLVRAIKAPLLAQ